MLILPNEVKYIISKLHEFGFKAYVVGGCVRDSLLNQKPKDWDITTSALPEDVKLIFKNDYIIPTGEKYGTLTIMLNHEGYEITTFRADGEYLDGRRPEAVTYSKTLNEDLERRDFTINSLAYNEQEGLVDLKGGYEDLKNQIIRCVGDPYKRFNEDALRIMRCFRFAFKYNFQIENNTLKAAYELKHNLHLISKERIREELIKIIKFASYEQLQIFKPILIEIINDFDACEKCEQNNKYHVYNVLDHSLMAVSLASDPIVKLALLLHDIGKPTSKIIKENEDHFPNHANESYDISLKLLKDLKFDNKLIKTLTTLIKHHADKVNYDEYSIRCLAKKIGKDLIPLWIEMRYSDIFSQSEFNREKRICKLELIKLTYETIVKNDSFFDLKKLAINGNDLISIGIEGENIKILLEECLDLVMRSPNLNNKKYLLLYLNYKK